jgi:hypothetical protein
MGMAPARLRARQLGALTLPVGELPDPRAERCQIRRQERGHFYYPKYTTAVPMVHVGFRVASITPHNIPVNEAW